MNQNSTRVGEFKRDTKAVTRKALNDHNLPLFLNATKILEAMG